MSLNVIKDDDGFVIGLVDSGEGEVSSALSHRRVNLMSREKALMWINAYRPVDYEMMPSPTQVYQYVGGELLRLHMTDPDYWDSCALRVSVALATLGIGCQGEYGAVRYSGAMHLIDEYAILGANNMTAYLRKILGPPTYESLEAYMKEREDQDILVMGGKMAGGQAHVGMAMGNDPSMMSEFTNIVWVLNRVSWEDPA